VADWIFRGESLVAAREAVHMTRAELAAAVDVANALRIEIWEDGHERPQVQLVPRLAAAVRIHPLELLDGDPAHPDLTRLRVAAGHTVRDVAERIGVSTMTYQRIEDRGGPSRGVRQLTVDSLAEVLGVPVAVVNGLLPRRRS
jgi:transcriptional regulator with XRE-family HTH domain